MNQIAKPAGTTEGYFEVNSPETIANLWKSFKGFTVRPVKSTEDYYADVLKRIASETSSIMIYGGTPEIRDAVSDLGSAATLVDRSETMTAALGLLTKSGQPLAANECFVKSDWRNLDLRSEIFDVLVGDDAINMVDWPDFTPFLSEAHRVLKPAGFFVCHLIIQPSEFLRKKSIETVFREWKSGEIPSHFELASRINFVHYSEESYRMGWQASIQGIRDAMTLGQLEDDEGFIERFKFFNSSFSCPPTADFESLLEGKFIIDDVFFPNEHDYCKFEPIYLLRKSVSHAGLSGTASKF